MGVLETMRIAAIGIEDKTSASRRIRFKAFLRNLPDGYTWFKWSGKMDCDVLYIQKALRDWTISAAAKAYSYGIPVVFDLDDIRQKWSDKPYDDMFAYCSAITTDTQLKAKEIRKHTNVSVHVVPDTIDYGAVSAERMTISKSIKSVVTFGRHQNVVAAKSIFSRLSNAVKLSYICDRDVGIKGEFIVWDSKRFLDDLCRHDLAILMHHQHWAVDMKSNNRLLVCMAVGMPVMLAQSKEYVSTLNAACRNKDLASMCIMKEQDNPIEAIDRLNSHGIRSELSDCFVSYAKAAYHPSISSKKLAEVFETCVLTSRR